MMSVRQIVGLFLVIVGIVALAWGGVFWTRNKTVLDAGPLEVKTQQHEGFSVPPIVSIGALVVGVALLVVPRRSRV
jgi:uncharacterized membrane protein YidH (DUF202 family)